MRTFRLVVARILLVTIVSTAAGRHPEGVVSWSILSSTYMFWLVGVLPLALEAWVGAAAYKNSLVTRLSLVRLLLRVRHGERLSFYSNNLWSMVAVDGQAIDPEWSLLLAFESRPHNSRGSNSSTEEGPRGVIAATNVTEIARKRWGPCKGRWWVLGAERTSLILKRRSCRKCLRPRRERSADCTPLATNPGK